MMRNAYLRRWVACAIGGFSFVSAWANEISLEQAKTAVAHWAKETPHPLGARLGQTVLSARTFSGKDGVALFHVVRFQEGGFVVAAADDGVLPVIAFSDDDDLVADERNPLWVMLNRDLPQRLDMVRKAARHQLPAQASDEVGRHSARWQQLLFASAANDYTTLDASVSDLRVSPFLATTWDQQTAYGGACYNYYVPPYAAGNTANYPCGCVATAGAQLMRFHRYPTASVAAGTYTIWVDGVSSNATMLGGTYDWSGMVTNPLASSTTLANRQAIGKLTYDVGVACYMDYTSTGSGAYDFNLVDALKSRFGYTNAVIKMDQTSGVMSSITNAALSNLDAKYPVVFGIYGSSGGHEVVGDGYGYTGGKLYVHLNMGWSGQYNAWYNLPTVSAYYSFTLVDSIVYNVFPTSSVEVVSGRIVDNAGAAVSGATVVATNQSNVGMSAVVSDANGIYAFLVPKPSTSESYTIYAQYGARAATQSTTIRASVSTTYSYNPSTGGTSYNRKTGTVGSRGAVNLTLPDPAPAAPDGVAAGDGASTASVAVSWSAATYATGYGVYRHTSDNSASASWVGSASGTTYSDTSATPGTLYYYWVRATNTTGSSAFSASDSGYRALSAPANVIASESSTGAVAVAWGAVAGATYYRVYRSEGSAGTKTALGDWQTAQAYSDASAEPGTTYFYWVAAAVDASGARASGYGDYDTGLRLVAAPLDVALDATNLVWTTDGSAGWFGQTNAAYDGVDAARSGALADGQTNWLRTAVCGRGTLTFWWGVSSEPGADVLSFAVDGTNLWTLSGTTDWAQQAIDLGVGTHALTWAYSKNASGSSGADCGWVDQVSWSPATSTATTPVPVPYAWLDAYGLVSSGDYEAAGHADADGDGYRAWQEYVAGTVPTNAASVFQALIGLSNGLPVVTWAPDLGAVRVYTVEGKSALTNAAWLSPTNAATRFYRVKVDVP